MGGSVSRVASSMRSRLQSALAHLTTANGIQLVIVFVVWFAGNIIINLYNKFILSKTGFAFPLTLTCSNKLIGWLGSITMLSCNNGLPDPRVLYSQFRRPMVHAHGIVTALNIGLNNWSLVLVSLTINQLIKSLAPLPTAALSTALEGKSYSWHVYGSMCVLVFGTLLASAAPGAEATWLGVFLCFGSVMSGAAWTVIGALLLQSGAAKLDAVSLVFVSSPTSILSLLLFASALEFQRLFVWMSSDGVGGGDAPEAAVAAAAASSVHVPQFGLLGAFYMIVGGLLGFSYDLIHNHFLRLTSSVTISVVGNAKLAVLIGISMATLERTPSMWTLIGVVVALSGCVWYTIYRVEDQRAQEAAKEVAAAAATAGASATGGAPGATESTGLLGAAPAGSSVNGASK